MRDPFVFNPETDRPVAVEIHTGKVCVTLAPRLAQATPQQQAHIELHNLTVDWPDLDEGLDIQGMLMGIRPITPESAS